MNFNRDFIKYFGEVEIVHKTHEIQMFYGTWNKGTDTAAGMGNLSISEIFCHFDSNFHVPDDLKNPQFLFKVGGPNPDNDLHRVIVSLTKKSHVGKERFIGFSVFKVKIMYRIYFFKDKSAGPRGSNNSWQEHAARSYWNYKKL